MAEFDPMQVNAYTVKQLADFIESGTATIEEIYSAGYAASRRPELEAELKRRKQIVLEEEEAWERSRRMHTVDGYKRYLRKYDVLPEEGYRGKHLAEAKDAIEELEEELVELRRELFDEMRANPSIFKQDGMRQLFAGVRDEAQIEALRGMDDITSRFLASGQKIAYDDLINEGIIPRSISREALTTGDTLLQQTNLQEIGEFPEERRTDIYFIGVPRGGKSSVLAGILSYMNNNGYATYQPHWNSEDRDVVKRYYYGLVSSTSEGKFPVSTAADTISFMKFQLFLDERKNDLTFVEIGGEAFRQASNSGYKGAKAWGKLGASSCLKSKNKKLLFFILDYGVEAGTNKEVSIQEQQYILNDALEILSSDGEGENGTEGCTLSKVLTVAVLVTKCDLMGSDGRKERKEKAKEYVDTRFKSFMKTLVEKTKQFGINQANGYKPYIFPFSSGRICVGNTYVFDPTDSAKIVHFISTTAPSTRTDWLSRLLGRV